VDDRLVRWCAKRQVPTGGFQGRRNKVPDTCYSFWVGASLVLLERYDAVVNRKSTRAFHVEQCQSRFGGFTKLRDDVYPDVLHSYFSLCALSMLGEPGLEPLDCALCISERAAARCRAARAAAETGDADQGAGAGSAGGGACGSSALYFV
jgi:geranylgeranyl transferase type-1 subunit beta